MTTPKPPTAQSISALLRKAGFERSVETKDGDTKGFSVHRVAVEVPKGCSVVFVHYRPAPSCWDDVIAAMAMLGRYETAVTAAGWPVELTSYAGSPDVFHLTVTAPKTEG